MTMTMTMKRTFGRMEPQGPRTRVGGWGGGRLSAPLSAVFQERVRLELGERLA